MNTLSIKKADFYTKDMSIETISKMMDKLSDYNKIAESHWEEFQYKPQVTFKILHTNNSILLKYYIKEDSVRAEFTENNQSVCKDSCVEFFISLTEGFYYNFEFNCIGTCLLNYGTAIKRSPISDDAINSITRLSSLGNQPFEERIGDTEWSITVLIPLQAFEKDEIADFSGLKGTANFYKCGDWLSKPHYVTWNRNDFATPSFHRPEYFGKIEFI